MDGRSVGKTPLERSDIRAGVREVRLQHPHYETVRESGRRFNDGRVVRIQRRLVRGRGALTVTATPRQAWVEVGGRRLAEQTPVTLEDLPAGRLEVKLGAREHRPLSVEVEIPKDGLVRLERGLAPIPYGSLTLDLQPSDARVTLPEVKVRYRPGMRLQEGTYRVVAQRDGYQDVTRTINVSGDTRVRIALEKAGPTAGESRVFDGIEFVWIPPGEFRMGSTSRHADSDEKPVTRVRITEGFWLGKYEVTQRQWQAVMGSNPSGFKNCGGNCPVERVSWNNVQEYIRKLNGRTGGRPYRLPTEAEWEYAARAGKSTDTYAGDLQIRGRRNAPLLDRIAWYGATAGELRWRVRLFGLEGEAVPVAEVRDPPGGWQGSQCLWVARHVGERVGVGGGLERGLSRRDCNGPCGSQFRLGPGLSGRWLVHQRQVLPVGESRQDVAGRPPPRPRFPPAEEVVTLGPIALLPLARRSAGGRAVRREARAPQRPSRAENRPPTPFFTMIRTAGRRRAPRERGRPARMRSPCGR